MTTRRWPSPAGGTAAWFVACTRSARAERRRERRAAPSRFHRGYRSGSTRGAPRPSEVRASTRSGGLEGTRTARGRASARSDGSRRASAGTRFRMYVPIAAGHLEEQLVDVDGHLSPGGLHARAAVAARRSPRARSRARGPAGRPASSSTSPSSRWNVIEPVEAEQDLVVAVRVPAVGVAGSVAPRAGAPSTPRRGTPRGRRRGSRPRRPLRRGHLAPRASAATPASPRPRSGGTPRRAKGRRCGAPPTGRPCSGGPAARRSRSRRSGRRAPTGRGAGSPREVALERADDRRAPRSGVRSSGSSKRRSSLLTAGCSRACGPGPSRAWWRASAAP